MSEATEQVISGLRPPVRSGDSLTAILDGTAGTPTSVAGVTLNDPAGAYLQIGLGSGGFYGDHAWDGMLDEIRMTRAARDCSVVPTAAFPDF